MRDVLFKQNSLNLPLNPSKKRTGTKGDFIGTPLGDGGVFDSESNQREAYKSLRLETCSLSLHNRP